MEKGIDYFGNGNEHADEVLMQINRRVEEMDALVASGEFKGSFVERMVPLQMLYNYTMMKLGGQAKNGE